MIRMPSPSNETQMMPEQVLEHRLSLAATYLKWSPKRISAFRAGYADARANQCDARRRDQHDGSRHGFIESDLSMRLVDSLGYRDGLRAFEARSLETCDYRGNQALLSEIARYWSANGNLEFDLETAEWSDTAAEDLSVFLGVMDRNSWIAWFVAEHEASIEDGRDGYGDLLVQDVFEHVVYVAYRDGQVDDIWDGWHRIGASMLKAAGYVPAIRGNPAPAPVLVL